MRAPQHSAENDLTGCSVSGAKGAVDFAGVAEIWSKVGLWLLYREAIFAERQSWIFGVDFRFCVLKMGETQTCLHADGKESRE